MEGDKHQAGWMSETISLGFHRRLFRRRPLLEADEADAVFPRLPGTMSVIASADEFGRNSEFIAGIQVCGRGRIVGSAHVGDCVEQLVVVGSSLTLVGRVHTPPFIPGKHLDLVQCGEVSKRVTADLTRSPVTGPVYAVPCGVYVAGAEGLPRFAASEELAGTQVFRLGED
jgi:hypothetical protein